ncbi:hypothetical protein [Kitasatospora phosalacinea]|uniref:hypothetical protein n=1 Tax=Kitasatospora phosalacinea TaxID=2065 RepID=UPI000525D29E|nr:hypothetical protein [Kitasatospora phosalacinea]
MAEMAQTEHETARLRAHRVEAEGAADAVETAWRLAGLPSEPSVMPVTSGRGLDAGAHVSLGGCSAATARALADVLTEYARLTGRLIDGGSQRILARVLAGHGVRPVLPGDGAYVVARESSA